MIRIFFPSADFSIVNMARVGEVSIIEANHKEVKFYHWLARVIIPRIGFAVLALAADVGMTVAFGGSVYTT